MEWSFQMTRRLDASPMMGFAAIEQSDDDSGIEENWLHDLPNPAR
jgi:hypothetical protein